MDAWQFILAIISTGVITSVITALLAGWKIRNDLRSQLLDDLQEERTKAQDGHADCLKNLTELLETRIVTLETLNKTTITAAKQQEG